MTVSEFQARKIERIAEALAHFVATTPGDRLDWQPSACAESGTRSILAQVGECVLVNRYVAALLRGENPPPAPARDAPSPIRFADGEDARAQLVASGRELAATVRALDEGALQRTFPHWRGPLTGEVLLEAPYRNMAYHAGQVNFIQCLAGDTEFHVPPTWL